MPSSVSPHDSDTPPDPPRGSTPSVSSSSGGHPAPEEARSSPLVLVVEDDLLVMEIIVDNLSADGFRVLAAHSVAEALGVLRTQRPNAIVLDIMLPDGDGYQFCERLRQGKLVADPAISSLPVLMLTARAQDEDQLEGFWAGADDYLTKPFNPLHLSARLKAIIRRTQNGSAHPNEIQVRSLTIYVEEGIVRCYGQLLDLAPTERHLLVALARHLNEIVTREELLQQVWQWPVTGGLPDTRTVDVHINRLRSRLTEADPALAEIIKTVRGRGYMLQSEPAMCN